MQDVTMMPRSKSSLSGTLLVATPAIHQGIFKHSVIYLCAHDQEGAMGIIVNTPIKSVAIEEIYRQVGIEEERTSQWPLHLGGPVDANRGFILHSDDVMLEDSIKRPEGIALTSNIDLLRLIADGQGPSKGFLSLGYAGWTAGQLESEIESGSWITVPASKNLIFDCDNDLKWSVAVSSLGFDLAHLSSDVGHA